MYKTLSKYYDIFMQNVDYEKWISYVSSFLIGRTDGVDMGCGTGKFTIGLAKKGFNVYGVDLCPQMLNEAIKNAALSAEKLNFILGSVENFKFIKSPQFVTAMCDAVNYLKNPIKAFKNIFSSLTVDGIFIFDISSEYKLKTILGNNTYSDNKNDITYIWNNSLDEKNSCVNMELAFFEKQGELYNKLIETQTQFIHSSNKIETLLFEAGFSKVKIYSGISKKKVKETDERIHFIAYK